jgi:hypothetical protein
MVGVDMSGGTQLTPLNTALTTAAFSRWQTVIII